MTRCVKVVVALSILAVFAGITTLYAVWEENGVLICGAPGSDYEIVLSEADDSGIIVAWEDERGTESDVYASKLDPFGNVLWTPDGVPVCTAAGSQRDVMAVSDGVGGAIIAWDDSRIPEIAIYAQRIDAMGNLLWTADGDTVYSEINSFSSMAMVADGAGGTIIVWSDNRGADFDIYGQRIDENGTRLWPATGILLCSASNNQYTRGIVDVGGGEFMIAIEDHRNIGSDVFVQKFDTTGTTPWGIGGDPVCNDAAAQFGIVLTADGAGGAVFAWTDDRNVTDEIFAQRISSNGSDMWISDGVSISDGQGTMGRPGIVPDTEGGAIINFNIEYGMLDFHSIIQRVDRFGNIQWYHGGVKVSAGYWPTYSDMLCPDGEGGAIVLMYDLRDYQTNSTHFYAQKIDHDGTPRWLPGGVPVFHADTEAEEEEADYGFIASDNLGGAYCVWTDNRTGEYDLYGSRINGYGGLGGLHDPATISSINDVPNDQGGKMMLRWLASPADTFPNAHIDSYSAWRLLPDPGAAAMPALELDDIVIDSDAIGEAMRRIPTAAGDAWELVGFIPARQAEEYALMVESLYDSMDSDPGWQYFVVTAHMEGSILFFDSPVDSGYSVDNLSPAMPVAFEGIQSLAPPGLRVYWDLGSDSDLGYYEVYKGPAEDFVPGVSNLVGSVADTELLDESWTPGDEDFFKLLAVDVHGNRGPAALLRPENIYVGTLLQNFSAAWTGSWIEIAWTLSEADTDIGFHFLRAKNPGGEFEEIEGPKFDRDGMAFVFEDHDCEPGITYSYRIELEENGNRRVLFETDEITAPVLPLTLGQNVPNPFNPSTSIAFYLPERSHVRIDVYDVTGRLVTTLTDGTRSGGSHTVEWNGSDTSGRSAASGVYFYRLVAGKSVQTKKMILLR